MCTSKTVQFITLQTCLGEPVYANVYAKAPSVFGVGRKRLDKSELNYTAKVERLFVNWCFSVCKCFSQSLRLHRVWVFHSVDAWHKKTTFSSRGHAIPEWVIDAMNAHAVGKVHRKPTWASEDNTSVEQRMLNTWSEAAGSVTMMCFLTLTLRKSSCEMPNYLQAERVPFIAVFSSIWWRTLWFRPYIKIGSVVNHLSRKVWLQFK